MKSTFITWICLIYWLTACATPSQMTVDAQVRELCAKDGGIKVYETVTLPPDKFNSFGQINFYKPDANEGALGEAYRFEIMRTTYIAGEPTTKPGDISSQRAEVRVTRRQDEKILGRSVWYTRAGGDPFGPWMPSSFKCPSDGLGENYLFSKIFVKGDGK